MGSGDRNGAAARRARRVGENVSAYGLGEDTVAIGDRFRLGSALVEVSQGPQPCFRLNLRFGRSDMARLMQQNGRTGWYFRVIDEGEVTARDSLVRVDRVAPEWTIERIRRAFHIDRMDSESLTALAALTPLAEGWRALASRRLATAAAGSRHHAQVQPEQQPYGRRRSRYG